MNSKLAYFAVNTADLTRTSRLRSPRDVAAFLLGKRVDHYVILIQRFVDGQPQRAVSYQLTQCEYLPMYTELEQFVKHENI